MSDDVEIDWLSDRSETMAFWKSNLLHRDTSALAKETREKCSEAMKDYDYLADQLSHSVILKQKRLEKLLALMKEEKGDRIRIKFKDDHPVFFQKETASEEATFRGIIAPMLDPEKLEEMRGQEEEA